jgi:hypothetical protein
MPSGYAIGNCLQGEQLVRTWKSDLADGNYYDGGYIGAHFLGCGWIVVSDDVSAGSGTSGTCSSSASTGLSSFAAFTNDALKGPYDVTTGTPVQQRGACDEYANYRPWTTANHRVDFVRTSPAPGNLRWRYATKYNDTDGSGQYVMVQDPRFGHGQGNWVFVPRSCLYLTDTLATGKVLQGGLSLFSPDGQYAAIMQTDGNLVVYANGVAQWNSGTAGNPGAYLWMQSDGNLVIYASNGSPLWWTDTQPSSNDRLTMQTDGNLVVYDGSGRARWSWMTGRLP